ncbi:MAG TPA: leucine/isoleucine/valine transporter permease subunit, partial [Anaerolineae bacterium]|nr:leucine/isoleucine/valine transporter permease subunit [Anaerolineae bacterium]
MNARPRFHWQSVVQVGLLGGVIALFLCLVGIVEASNGTTIVSGVISMGQTILIIAILFPATLAVRSVRTGGTEPSRLSLVVGGTLGSLVTAAMLALLVLIGSWIDLRAVFINASPELYEMLTFGLGIPAGLIVMLVVGAAIGALTGLVLSLDDRFQQPIITGLGLIPVVAILWSALFAGRGLSIVGAVVIFVVGAGGTFLWFTSKAGVQTRIAALPPRGQTVMHWSRRVVPALLILAIPILGSYPSEIMDNVGIFVLMGLGLNIVVGFAGLLDLGYVAFFAIGAYTMGVLTSPEMTWHNIHLGFWGALPFAVLMATLWGVILGIPVLGMRGDYLAIVTLGFGEIIRLLALSDALKPFIGGSNGITAVPKATVGPIQFNTPQTLFYLILAACLLAVFVSTRVKDSRLGRAWMALREDEDVAEAMGIDLVRTKLMAFATGAAFAGLGGAIFASKLTSIYPHSMQLLISINVLCVVIVGGIGSIPGVVVGSLFLIGLPEILREFAEYRMLMYGAALVIMMLVRPEGLVPEARRRLELHEGEAGAGE